MIGAERHKNATSIFRKSLILLTVYGILVALQGRIGAISSRTDPIYLEWRNRDFNYPVGSARFLLEEFYSGYERKPKKVKGFNLQVVGESFVIAGGISLLGSSTAEQGDGKPSLLSIAVGATILGWDRLFPDPSFIEGFEGYMDLYVTGNGQFRVPSEDEARTFLFQLPAQVRQSWADDVFGNWTTRQVSKYKQFQDPDILRGYNELRDYRFTYFKAKNDRNNWWGVDCLLSGTAVMVTSPLDYGSWLCGGMLAGLGISLLLNPIQPPPKESDPLKPDDYYKLLRIEKSEMQLAFEYIPIIIGGFVYGSQPALALGVGGLGLGQLLWPDVDQDIEPYRFTPKIAVPSENIDDF
ncbi:hypothetical protein EBR96_04190 [bacterium]|nr:hypothetical protein [bacterium]